MKKSFQKLVAKVHHADDGSIRGGFSSLRGGMSVLYVRQNSTCTNMANCGGTTNTGDCVNNGDCNGTTNTGHPCTNASSCDPA